MRLRGRRIAVVGGGIGGLAAALALARRGARVTVFEQAPLLAEVGAGIQIGPNGVAVLDALGLREAAEAVASLPPAVVLRDGVSGREAVRLPLGGACLKRYGRPYWQFHRADLVALLAEACARAGVELRLGTRVRQLEHAEDGVAIRLEQGTERAEIAVAADGVRSPTRARHFAGAPPRFTGFAAWRGCVPADRLPPEAVPQETTVFLGTGRHLVAYPLRRGTQVNVVAVERRADWVEEGWSHPDLPSTVRAAFAGWCGEAEALLRGLVDVFLWGIFDHPELPAWTRGRIALLGDACHPMVPFLAQGAAMALEDAWVLAAELDAAADPADGLRAYERRRKPRASRVQRAALAGGRLYHLPAPLRGIVHRGLSAAGRLAPGLITSRFDWLYGVDVTGRAPPRARQPRVTRAPAGQRP